MYKISFDEQKKTKINHINDNHINLRFLYIFWGFGLLCGITMDWQALQIDWNVFNYLFFANYVLQKFYFCMDVSKDIWNFLYKAPRSLQKSLIWAEMTCFVTRARFVLILTKLKLGNWKCKQIFKVFKTDRRFEMLVPCHKQNKYKVSITV